MPPVESNAVIQEGRCNELPKDVHKARVLLEKMWEVENKKHLKKLSAERMEEWKAEKTNKGRAWSCVARVHVMEVV